MKKCCECGKRIKEGYKDPNGYHWSDDYVCKVCFDDKMRFNESYYSDCACINGCCACCGCSCESWELPDEELYPFE